MAHDLDARSDLFTLGLLLYECLVNRSPYAEERFASNLYSMLYAVTHEDVPTDDLPGSPELREVVRRCTRRPVEQRYPSPQEFLRALRSTPEAVAGGPL
jgi:serine/threonine protein kinase